MPSKP